MHATMSTSKSAYQTVSANNDDIAPVPRTSWWVRGPQLGSGAFAQVYLASDAAGQPMAVKTASTQAAAKSLRHEEAVLSLLQGCPYVVPCLGHDVTHDDFYGEAYNLFLEYAPGGSLADLIKRSGSQLSENLVRRLTREILRGLAFVHGQGYVHCDVKPQNILVFQTKSENGIITNVKLADFGLAKKVGKTSESSLLGTMLYMSPESLSGQREPPMDVWVVGLVVIEMLTGKPAYHLSAGVEPCTLLFRICFKEEMPEIPETMSEQGRDFVGRCFERDPAQRWTADMLLRHPFISATPPSAAYGGRQPVSSTTSTMACLYNHLKRSLFF